MSKAKPLLIQVSQIHRGQRGKRTIEAAHISPCGRFAIHRTLDTDVGGRWRVSHLPTGGFIVMVTHKRLAEKALRELEAIKGPWGSRSRSLIRRRLGEQVKPILQRYDLRFSA